MNSSELFWLDIFPWSSSGPVTLVVGLVHGNEIVGKQVIDRIQTYANHWNHQWTIMTLVANPIAYQHNVRFMDTDLNRSFWSENLSQDRESLRAREIMDYFNDIHLDYVFDVHSTPSRSDPMILCTRQQASKDLATKFPLRYVVHHLVDSVEWEPLMMYFVKKGSVGLAFEAWCHYDQETLRTGEKIADIILNHQNCFPLPLYEWQVSIVTTDALFTSDVNFEFAKDYKGFELVPAGEIWGRDTHQAYRFATDKIIMIPNIKFRDDLQKKSKTWLVYFWEQQ
jgi:hypothetical protein